MRVAPADGSCRSCSAELEILDADDATMLVECQNPECGDTYQVEPDAFGDGCVTYYIPFMASREQAGD